MTFYYNTYQSVVIIYYNPDNTSGPFQIFRVGGNMANLKCFYKDNAIYYRRSDGYVLQTIFMASSNDIISIDTLSEGEVDESTMKEIFIQNL